MTADALVSRHTAAWRAATGHPFLAGVRDGSVREDCFDRWLPGGFLLGHVNPFRSRSVMVIKAKSRIGD